MSRGGYFLISLLVLAADQLTKLAADEFLRGERPVEVIPGLFNLIYSLNRGGLFGYFSDLGGPWRAILLTGLPLLAIALLVGYLLRGDNLDRLSLTALSLILGGAAGNLIDRLVRGSVVDFLDFYASPRGIADWLVARFGTAHWPTFNLADSAIVVGAILLLITLVRPQPVAAKDAPTG